jgi:nucleolar protein 6
MSDSDSDYDVELYVKPDTIRRTYNNEDAISDNEAESEHESDNSEAKEGEESDAEIKTPSCKLSNGTNGFTETDISEPSPVKQPTQPIDEPVKTNSRYILYVTNLTVEITRTMLEDFFGDAGEVKSIRIPKVRMGCYAFVEMKDIEGYKVS